MLAESADVLTVRSKSLSTEVEELPVLADDREHLDLLRRLNPKLYRNRRNRIVAAELPGFRIGAMGPKGE